MGTRKEDEAQKAQQLIRAASWLRTNDEAGAAALLKAALRLDPTNPEAVELHGELTPNPALTGDAPRRSGPRPLEYWAPPALDVPRATPPPLPSVRRSGSVPALQPVSQALPPLPTAVPPRSDEDDTEPILLTKVRVSGAWPVVRPSESAAPMGTAAVATSPTQRPSGSVPALRTPSSSSLSAVAIAAPPPIQALQQKHADQAKRLRDALRASGAYPALGPAESTEEAAARVSELMNKAANAAFAEVSLPWVSASEAEAMVATLGPREDMPLPAPERPRVASLPSTVFFEWWGLKPQTARVLEFMGGPQRGRRQPVLGDGALLTHAGGETELSFVGGTIYVSDEEGSTLSYVEVRGERRVGSGARIRAATREFLLELPTHADGGVSGLHLHELDGEGEPFRTARFTEPLVTVGRLGCTLSFPKDDAFAEAHFELTSGPWATFLADCSGGRGTYLRVASGEHETLREGEGVWIGDHLIRLTAV